MLGVEVDSPQPVGLPVRAHASDVDREVVEPVAARGGSTLGFWSYNGFYPARDTVVVILSNLDAVQINPISGELNRLATTATG